MVRRLAPLFTLVLAYALAQAPKPLYAGAETLSAVYPLGRGVSYTEARALARALGLGYAESTGDVYLTLGARAIRLPVLSSARAALARPSEPLAYREKGRVLVPVKRVAQALGAVYRGSEAAIYVDLPPARLLDYHLVTSGGQDQLYLRFSRDVNLVPQGRGSYLVVGARSDAAFLPVFGAYLAGVELASHPLGLLVSLAGTGGAPVRAAPVPKGLRVWVGADPPKRRPAKVVVDGGRGYSKEVALRLVRALKSRGYDARLAEGKTARERAEEGAAADVFLVLSPGEAARVYTYRPRGRELELRFLARAREALLLGGAPKALRRQVAPSAVSAQLAEALARVLGAGRSRAEIAELAWAAKAAALVELPPDDPAILAARLARGVMDYLGGAR